MAYSLSGNGIKMRFFLTLRVSLKELLAKKESEIRHLINLIQYLVKYQLEFSKGSVWVSALALMISHRLRTSFLASSWRDLGKRVGIMFSRLTARITMASRGIARSTDLAQLSQLSFLPQM